MVFADDVGRNDEFPVLVFLEEGNEDVLVRLPTATGNEDLINGNVNVNVNIGLPLRVWCCKGVDVDVDVVSMTYKILDNGELLGGFLDLQHAVEAGVADNGDVGDA